MCPHLPSLVLGLFLLTGGPPPQDAPGWGVRFPDLEPDAAPAEAVFTEIERAMVTSLIGKHFWIRPEAPPPGEDAVAPVAYTIHPTDEAWETSLQRIVDFLVHLDHGSGVPLRVTGLWLERTGDESWRPRIQVAAPREREEAGAARPLSAVAVFRSVVEACAASERDLGDLRFDELSVDLTAEAPVLRLEGSAGGSIDLRALLVEVLPASPFLVLTEENRREATQVARDDGRFDLDMRFDVAVETPSDER